MTDYLALVMPRKDSQSAQCYWFAGAVEHARALSSLGREVVADSVDEDFHIFPLTESEDLFRLLSEKARHFALRQFRPGVTDNSASAVRKALSLTGLDDSVKVASGMLYMSKDGPCEVPHNKLTERVAHYRIDSAEALLAFPHRETDMHVGHDTVDIDVDDERLVALSKERLLSLSLAEMQAVREHFADATVRAVRKSHGLPHSPTDVELEIIAQTWSEHCKHKIFNARIEHTSVVEHEDGVVEVETGEVIDSLYKTYIKGATARLREARTDLLSVFEDNAGVVRFDDDYAVCFKVETHNSPSALEPYGGALTGILGVNRDILGTGLGARPIFNTDVFCFAHPHSEYVKNIVNPALLPAADIVVGVRQGVQDGGNKSGIPTINGAVFFDDCYRAKPLVYCGTGGLLPLRLADGRDAVKKHTAVGDAIIMAGGLVGRDGVHGATFSSIALDETATSDVVQIGDPFTQKRLTDFVLAARDAGLLTGITDNGAGGLSSSVGEMAGQTGGAALELADVPLKYPGLADWQIVVSESQERMTLATDRPQELLDLARQYDVTAVRVGSFDDSGYFRVTRNGRAVALLSLDFLHDGAPRLVLESEWRHAIHEEVGQPAEPLSAVQNPLTDELLALLASANVCSREAIVRLYDHEVQGGSVIKPYMGKAQNAPCDAGVILPRLDSKRALAVSCGLAPLLSAVDPALMACSAVDEAVRNIVCVGGDPDTLSLLDNFCWPDPVYHETRNPLGREKLGQLVLSVKALYDICLEYGAPLISGKDSMKNNFDDGRISLAIEPTLLVSALAMLPDCDLALSSDFKAEGDIIYLACAGAPSLAASVWGLLRGRAVDRPPHLNAALAIALYRKLHRATLAGLVSSMHDVSDGGLAVTLAECCIGGNVGADLQVGSEHFSHLSISEGLRRSLGDDVRLLFGEGPGQIVLSVSPANEGEFMAVIGDAPVYRLGQVQGERLVIRDSSEQAVIDAGVEALSKAYRHDGNYMGGGLS